MEQANGCHHVALRTGNLKRQIEFFTDVVGTKLVALYWMHGFEGAMHAFLRLNDRCSLAFVHMPAVAVSFDDDIDGRVTAECLVAVEVVGHGESVAA